MPAIMITEPIAGAAVEELRQRGYTITTEYQGEDMHSCAPEEVQAVIVRARPITREWMARYPNLKIVAYHGVGTDNIDLEAARERHIRVTVTPGRNSLAVAEHTMALMLALSKRLTELHTAYREKGYDAKYDFRYTELSGKTLGLVGLGNIGKHVAGMAGRGFGMRVLAYTPRLQTGDVHVEPVERMQLFRESDYVSLHLPLNEQTRHSIGAAELEAMKPTACLINTARGGIVDEAALIRALQSGSIAGAGLDVTDPEPAVRDNPLFRLPNVIMTPHVAASSEEALMRVAMMCIESIEDTLHGREPQGAVV